MVSTVEGFFYCRNPWVFLIPISFRHYFCLRLFWLCICWYLWSMMQWISNFFFPTNHFRVMVWVENDPLNITPYWKNQLWRWVENDPLDINGLKARSSRKHLRELTSLKLSSGYYSFSLANHFCSTLHCDITHVKGHEREFRSTVTVYGEFQYGGLIKLP